MEVVINARPDQTVPLQAILEWMAEESDTIIVEQSEAERMRQLAWQQGLDISQDFEAKALLIKGKRDMLHSLGARLVSLVEPLELPD